LETTQCGNFVLKQAIMNETIPNFIRVTLNPQQVQGMGYTTKGVFLNLSIVLSIEDGVQQAKIVVSPENQELLAETYFGDKRIAIRSITTDINKLKQS
jgi:hypothetical protein